MYFGRVQPGQAAGPVYRLDRRARVRADSFCHDASTISGKIFDATECHYKTQNVCLSVGSTVSRPGAPTEKGHQEGRSATAALGSAEAATETQAALRRFRFFDGCRGAGG